MLHLDLGAGPGFRPVFDEALGDVQTFEGQLHHARRVRVQWGTWSMVEATLSGLETLQAAKRVPGHVHLLSGADYPIRSLSDFSAFLARHPGVDFIEHVDAESQRWVRDGPQTARYRCWHAFNWRQHPRLFSISLALQRRLGVHRHLPNGLRPHLGAQWWTLSWDSCERALALASEPGVRRFFRRCWIPDELYFQTVVASLVAPERRVNTRLTHCLFGAGGTPVVFHDDHLAYLEAQPAFFARKLSPRASALRDALDQRPPGTDQPQGIARPHDENGQKAYAQFIARHATGIPGQFSWGRLPDPWQGALGRVRRPWFVLVGNADDTLESLRKGLDAADDIECHGALLAARFIGFREGIKELCGLKRSDTALRDQDRHAFLADVVRQSPARWVGFTLGPDDLDSSKERREWLQRLESIPGARVIDVTGNHRDDSVGHRFPSDSSAAEIIRWLEDTAAS